MSDWDMAFMNTNDNEKVFICKETVLNIFSNFIPHETSIIGDKDPPWFPKKKISSNRKSMFIKATEIVKAIITCNT